MNTLRSAGSRPAITPSTTCSLGVLQEMVAMPIVSIACNRYGPALGSRHADVRQFLTPESFDTARLWQLIGGRHLSLQCFAAAHGRKWHRATVLIWLIFSSAIGVGRGTCAA